VDGVTIGLLQVSSTSAYGTGAEVHLPGLPAR